MPFSMTSSCILGFQATWPPTNVGKSPGESQSISEANNIGLQTQQCLIGQVAENSCRGRFNTEKNGDLNFSEGSKEDH